MGQTDYAEVTPVQGEHSLNPFTVGKVQQRGVGKLYSQPFILGEDRRDPRKVRLALTNQLKGAAMVGFQQDGHDRAGVYQDLAGEEPPNPSEYFGFVLRSRAVPFTAPINPAFFARS